MHGNSVAMLLIKKEKRNDNMNVTDLISVAFVRYRGFI